MKIDKIYFYLTIFFYLALWLNPNNKTLFIFYLIYGVLTWLLSRNFRQALLFTYLASWPIQVGKTYSFDLIPAAELNIPGYPFGIGSGIIISIQDILIAVMFTVLMRDFIVFKILSHTQQVIFRLDKLSALFLGYFLALVISSYVGSIRPDISLLQSLYAVAPLILYWYFQNLLDHDQIAKICIAILSATILFEAILSALQLFHGGPLGLSIEKPIDEILKTNDAQESTLLFRPLGTFGHANALAHYFLPYVGVFLPAFFLTADNLYLIGGTAALVGLLMTQSRSAWLSIFFTIVALLYIVEKRWHIRLTFVKIITSKWPGILALVSLIMIYIFPRIVSSFYTFGEFGSGYTRIGLIGEALKVIAQHPWFGVGLDMDVFYIYWRMKSVFGYLRPEFSVFSYFPHPVHNGYLRLLVESGIPSVILFLSLSGVVFIDFIKKMVTKKTNRAAKIIILSVVLGIGASYFNALLQPFLPNLRETVFLYILYCNRSNNSLLS